VKKELEENLRRYQEQQIEQQKLQQSLQILKLENASEMQQILITTNERLAKKEDELLRLRWTVQDLESDRAALENELKQMKNDPLFTSAHLTANNAQQYSIDLSKFMDEDDNQSSNKKKEEEKKVEKDEYRNISNYNIDENTDAGISSLVMQKMKQALEVAQKMKIKTGLIATSNNVHPINNNNNISTPTNNENSGHSIHTHQVQPLNINKKVELESKLQGDIQTDELDAFLRTPISEDVSLLRKQLSLGKDIIEQMRKNIDNLKMQLKQVQEKYDKIKPQIENEEKITKKKEENENENDINADTNESDDEIHQHLQDGNDKEQEKERILAKKKIETSTIFQHFQYFK